MTANAYEDLGIRLDDLAAAFTADIELTSPSTVAVQPSRTRFGRGAAILVANAAVIVLVIAFALWGRSSSSEVNETSPSVLAGLLPEWADVPAGVDVEGWMDEAELAVLFDMSTVRQINFDPGAVFVGLDPSGRNVAVAIGLRLDGKVLGSNSIDWIPLPDLFRENRLIVQSRGSLQVTTIGGVAPLGAVAVLVDGVPFDLDSGAFLLEFPPGLEFPRLQFEFPDGTAIQAFESYGLGAPGATGSLSADIEGSFVDRSLDSVNCVRLDSEPVAFDFSASRGDASLPGDWLVIALRSEGMFLLARVDDGVAAAFVPNEELVIVADEAGLIELTWDTDTTSGSATINCGDFIIDAAELAALLRLGPALADLLPEWADVPVGVDVAGLHEGFDPAGLFDMSTVRQIDFDSGSVLVGIGFEEGSVAVGYGNIDDDTAFGLTSGPFSSLVALDWASYVVLGFPGSTTVAGVVPRGVVNVSVVGQVAELRSGVFLVDLGLAEPGNINFFDIDIELADGTIEKLGRTSAGAGASVLEATIEGVVVQREPQRVACTYFDRDPSTIELLAIAGFPDAESMVAADLADGTLKLDGFEGDVSFRTTIEPEDLSVQISDSLREVTLSWDTAESSGSMFVDCGSTVFDMSELVELLRAD